MLSTLDFLTVPHSNSMIYFIYITALRIANTNHASYHKYGYVHTEISIAVCIVQYYNETIAITIAQHKELIALSGKWLQTPMQKTFIF